MRRNGEIGKYPRLQLDDVFEERIKKGPGCWIWTAGKMETGYGLVLHPGNRPEGAHRVAYRKWVGEIPYGFQVMHTCDVRDCVNPKHLRAVPQAINIADAVAKRRHAFGERNGHSKLTSVQVDAIRKDGRVGSIIAKEHGISQCHVSRIKTGARRDLG